MKPKILKINNLKINLNTWGSKKKPLLIFVHGWMDAGASFDFVCKKLEKDFYCVAPDLRGYGKSEHSKNPLGYFFYEYVADLSMLIDKLSPNKPVMLLGHSLGGNVASVYAGTYPERISHLINIEGFGLRRTDPSMSPIKVKEWLDGIKAEKSFKVYRTEKELTERLMKQNPRLTIKQATFLAHFHGKKVKNGFMFSADPNHKLTEPYLFTLEGLYAFWKNISAKTLLIYAEQTELAQWMGTDNIEEEIKSRFKKFPEGTKLECIKNSGHMIHLEQPEELAKTIFKFMFS